jgi:ribulose-phosphate 3-epimerase
MNDRNGPSNELSMHPVLVAPSVLSSNFARVEEGIALIERAGGDWVHLDVMDGHFVPNLTFGPKMVEDLRKLTKLPFDAHLMVNHPEKMLGWFADAGADQITFHLEAAVHVHRLLQEIHEIGVKAGISIVPSTPAEALREVLAYVDVILVMTVNPGFGGQELIPECVEKVSRLARMRKEGGHGFRISVDGGINRETAHLVKSAGADVLVTGSAFFSADDPADEVATLRSI